MVLISFPTAAGDPAFHGALTSAWEILSGFGIPLHVRSMFLFSLSPWVGC